MAIKNVDRSDKKASKSSIESVSAEEEEPELGLNENSSKKRKKNSASVSTKVRNGDEQPKWCQQCRRNRNDKDFVAGFKKCRYCITKWCPGVSEEEFSPKGYSCSETNKIKYSKQILQKVFPLVKRLNDDQLKEKEIEAKLKGVFIPELQLQDADIFCDRCGSYFFDLYRSCACGYMLCLVCCRELRDGQLKGMTCGWKSQTDGSIPCPPKDIGGCNAGTLELKRTRIMCVDWIVSFLEKVQGVYKINCSYDNTQISMGSLYSLSAKDIQPQHMQRFQFHWSKGEPIIVNDVLSTSSQLSWDSMLLCDLTKSSSHHHAYEVHAIDCFDWSKVTVNLSKFRSGYSADQFTQQGLPLILKLEDWQPEGKWPRDFVEFFNCLPFRDYTNPDNGYLNLAVKLPDESVKPDMGPKMDIAYGVEEELGYGDSVTKLHYEKSDTVNVMTHTKSDVFDQMEGVALWDIFQRQDVPMLEEYLRNHSAEFRHAGRLPVVQVFHPIHDQTFYLNMEHKRKLKEEFGIEPWTFKQKLGDAVFIPAGCPYQVRNLKSNTKVELNFISPESLGECIRLQNELRMLPNNHRAKRRKLDIGKIMVYALDHAVAELSRCIDSNGPNDDELLKVPKILKASKSTIQVQGKAEQDENSSKKTVKDENSGSEKVCQKCHQDLLVECKRCQSNNFCFACMTQSKWYPQACVVCCKEIEPQLKLVPTNDHIQDKFAKVPDIFYGIGVNHTNGWIFDSDSDENPQDTSVGVWKGNHVGQAAKELLQAVEHCYPNTFTSQRVTICSSRYRLSNLKELHGFIKGFLETSVDALTEDQITSLEDDLNSFERIGFDLSWARKRLHMVKNLKYENDLLRLEESLKLSHKELIEANLRLEMGRLDFDRFTNAQNKKAQRVGGEFDDVLNGNLGLGMLPGYY